MKILKNGTTTRLWLSRNDTYEWAHRPGKAWLCSYLSGKSLFVELDKGDLVDIRINGRAGDCDSCELTAIMNDFLTE